MLYILFGLIIIISFLAMLYITLYNKIFFSKIRIEEAETLIKEELENRYDLICSIKKIISKNTKREIKLFKELENEKNENITTYDLDKKINEVLDLIYVIRNDHPKLDEKKEFKELLRKVSESNTKINAAKSFYNENNQRLLTIIRKFPANLIAKIHKVQIHPYYEGKEIFNEVDDGIKI